MTEMYEESFLNVLGLFDFIVNLAWSSGVMMEDTK